MKADGARRVPLNDGTGSRSATRTRSSSIIPGRFGRSALQRKSIAQGRIGFADVYLVNLIDPQHARRQRDADKTRTRRNFELHVRLSEPLTTWYRALETVLPGTVIWELPEDGLAGLPGPRCRSIGDMQIFDQMMDILGSQRRVVR